MILADTSVWVDHLRGGDPAMAQALSTGEVLIHAFVVGELALGQLPRRADTLTELAKLNAVAIATPQEVAGMIERDRLFGRGIGYVDIHLLASVRLTFGVTLWTRDRRLRNAASPFVPTLDL